jgi:hypothetical protein
MPYIVFAGYRPVCDEIVWSCPVRFKICVGELLEKVMEFPLTSIEILGDVVLWRNLAVANTEMGESKMNLCMYCLSDMT